jgi:mannose-6-phosphate isomerase-like protein (cupin superfamily)
MTELQKVAVEDVASSLGEFWSQQVVGQANGNLFKVAKGISSTKWHAHEDQDEVFLVLSGTLIVQLRSGDVVLTAGDLLVVPRGVEHCPKADEEVYLLIVGPAITSNDAGGKPEWSFGGGQPPHEV